ncbi:V-type ATPase, V0 complex, 116kDa subunit family [Polychytrium aggregatum]|uniref:V-type ATPase, V0 complex, 116kDa subunit family n=1 Tax=Polychytrium aggregatum TaxID=110093 RepID=UPI0022FEA6FB|nr:V-type ATPase, V0 complex, 116kDa subunit family [Polychytrium aggregatum]KAI9206859.1 V-type ATPase, V0 complex, 116kDa subunit family [Polychytrium aggregatum]
MGNLFRSEEMSLVQLYIPLEIAQPTVAELGELGLIQFRDLNPQVNAFQRAFVNEIRRLDEMERKIRFLESQTKKAHIPIRAASDSSYNARTRTQQEIDELEQRLAEHESRVQQMNSSQETLNRQYLELTELRHVLRETAVFFETASTRRSEDGAVQREDTHLLAGSPGGEEDHEAFERAEGGGVKAITLGFVAGVIPRQRMGIFERILFRALRGNLFLNSAEIDEDIIDPASDEVVKKNVFIIFAHGKEILAKIKKICESLGATIYPVDDQADKRRETALDVGHRLDDLKTVLDGTKAARRGELSRVADIIDIWATMIKKEKAIYHVMNQFNYDINRRALIAEGWIPTLSIGSAQHALRTVTERTGSTIPPILNELRTTKEPPTYQRTNKVTIGFQEIVDAYGVANYREVNPGLFTVITFPFLFAVMFGDFGHGILMLLSSIWLIVNEKWLGKIKLDEISSQFYSGRYMILLMSIFSIYAGFIYNDMFSKSVDFFGSGYEFVAQGHNKTIGVQSHTYAFGVDPAWHSADNSLVFSNSYKMKMAIVLGVMHMLFGITLNVFNHIHFKKYINIYCEFIPQVIFMSSIFGYLAILIIFKWSNVWVPSQAPVLLNTLIYMFLNPGVVSPADQLFPGQANLQMLLLLIAFACVPWMLFSKPYLLWKEHQKHVAAGYGNLSQVDVNNPSPRTSEDSNFGGHVEMHQEEHFEFSEIMIHQSIHTVEFCLNCISNTASYLRLWALSLAHAQLSEVLWEMILGSCLELSPSILPFALVVGVGFWFTLTFFILIVMEGLSAFLHALRLHWVEFQGKFYGGNGHKFAPFSFAAILEESEEVE